MMRSILFLFSALAMLLGAAAPQPQPAPVSAPVIARPALWRVKDADTTIYLFGTVHVLKPGTRWFEGPIRTAFAGSDELVLEMVELPTAEANQIMLAKAIDPDGPALTAKLSPNDVAPYRAALRRFGLQAENFERLEPWFVSTIISMLPLQKLGYDADQGVEKTLTRAAIAAGKPITGLETMEQQLGFFDQLPEATQIKMLTQSVRDLPKAKPFARDMMRYWSTGQPDQLAKLMNRDMKAAPKLNKVLLLDRNKHWAAWIRNRLEKPGTVFVAVGAAHLAGKDSVQMQLRRYHVKTLRVI